MASFGIFFFIGVLGWRYGRGVRRHSRRRRLWAWEAAPLRRAAPYLKNFPRARSGRGGRAIKGGWGMRNWECGMRNVGERCGEFEVQGSKFEVRSSKFEVRNERRERAGKVEAGRRSNGECRIAKSERRRGAAGFRNERRFPQLRSSCPDRLRSRRMGHPGPPREVFASPLHECGERG